MAYERFLYGGENTYPLCCDAKPNEIYLSMRNQSNNKRVPKWYSFIIWRRGEDSNRKMKVLNH